MSKGTSRNRSRKVAAGVVAATLCTVTLSAPGVTLAEEVTAAEGPVEASVDTSVDALVDAPAGESPEVPEQPAFNDASGVATTVFDEVSPQDTADSSGATSDAAGTVEDQGVDASADQQQTVSYDYNATLYDPTTNQNGETVSTEYPGVYTTKIDPNTASAADAPTIGMPSIADKNLEDKPTAESPAIIQGAAVGYEEKVGPVEYNSLKERVDPYSKFKYEIVEEQAQDGTVHKKLTGFDGTYVITRLDVSSFFDGLMDVNNSYLHVKQENNNALMVRVGMFDNNQSFYDAMGNMTGAYRLADLLDKTGKDTQTPYLDVIVFSTGSIVAGADAGKQTALTGDIPLHLYVDQTMDYNPGLTYDATSTDPNHATNCLAKFFDETKVAANQISNYIVKGSDLALEVAVENSGGPNKDTETTYWSLRKSIEHPYYDQAIDSSPTDSGCGRTLKLISEVPIVGDLAITGTDANHLKKRTLNVNSFDIQVANNTAPDTQTYTAGVTLRDAWLTIADKSNTTGAEMAIGNNARFVIERGGKLVIDETCQLEIEWDGATTTPGAEPTTPDTLNNGLLDLRAGGTIQNNGIITIEGTEGKPYQPGQQQQAVESEKGEGILAIQKGSTLVNNGCLMVYGTLYNQGTLINNGKYADVIESNDPDKGVYAYHKGIQVAWKDDVTQMGVKPGKIVNGVESNTPDYNSGLLQNNGDILTNPGDIVNYGTIVNAVDANIYLATATEAIIPIEQVGTNPVVTTKRITLDPPVASSLLNYGLIINDGNIVPATVVLNDNGSFGAISVPGDHPELFGFPKSNNHGEVINRGYIYGWDDEETSGTSAVSLIAKAAKHLPATGDSTVAAHGILATLALSAVAFAKARLMRKE